ncbi:hypothetical protein [Mycoplasma zalophi]|uniref:Glucose-6-phosphate isomerase n=1 Tax=Mycoplasma zalophi TaxID=191287 RepID=A0ABS6DPK5_9MOLU|nr:hypothetical protein [Mycoplasma zalophi]MBU4690966.1 hypothetical protein [Mycoplasma zalophi]MBU4692255.1 hypothetical protein [Mycoplasma zalophi]
MIGKISLKLANELNSKFTEKYQKIIYGLANNIASRNIDGHEFLDFLDLANPKNLEVKEISDLSFKWKTEVNVLLVISAYSLSLHSKSVIDYIGNNHFINHRNLSKNKKNMEIIYLDHILNSKELKNLENYLDDKPFAIHVISKSGNDIDVLANFQFFSEIMERKLGLKNSSQYICITTNPNTGNLNKIAYYKQYKIFTFLDKIPEVYSIFTSVGLLPMACAGIDISRILSGAAKAKMDFSSTNLSQNIAYQYAFARLYLKNMGLDHEIFVNFDNDLATFSKYWQYLFSQTNSKENKSLYLDIANFSKEISTRSQFFQQGYKKTQQIDSLFLTILSTQRLFDEKHIGNYERNKPYFELPSTTPNQLLLYSQNAYNDLFQKVGHYQNIQITLEDNSEDTIGQLIVFLQNSSLMSAYLLGVNPFDGRSYDIYNRFLKDILEKI